MTEANIATIIGGHGFIGSHLTIRLKEQGWDCAALERNDSSLWRGNLGYVFYCAGLTADYANRPFDTVEAHVSLLNRVLREAQFESLVYLSSTRLYDSQPGAVGNEDALLLFNPAESRHIYDLSKALGESLCRVAGNGRARVARLSCVYCDQTDEDGFLPVMLRNVINIAKNSRGDNATLEVDSSPYFARDYVHLDDVMNALILIATRGQQLIYNVGSGENVTNASLFIQLETVSGCHIVPLRQDRAPMPARVSISRLKDEFGWCPTNVLEKVRQIVEEGLKC